MSIHIIQCRRAYDAWQWFRDFEKCAAYAVIATQAQYRPIINQKELVKMLKAMKTGESFTIFNCEFRKEIAK